MKQSVRWGKIDGDEVPSPFVRGRHQRALRMTLHAQGLTSLPSSEKQALATLLELAKPSQLEILQTEPGDFPHMEIGARDESKDLFPTVVKSGGKPIRSAAIDSASQWVDNAADIAGHGLGEQPGSRVALDDLLVAQAHCALGQDILVTLSPTIEASRIHELVRDANPCRPTEAARISGLLLRFRDDYSCYETKKEPASTWREQFYWRLACHKAPHLFRFLLICQFAGAKGCPDGVFSLADMLLQRCARALRARDEIGYQFYAPESSVAQASILYHLEYLTLVLVGAFDAQARIVWRAYKMEKPNEYSANFNWDGFRQALAGVGDGALMHVASDPSFVEFTKLLYPLRNQIHGFGLRDIHFPSRTERSSIFIDAQLDDEKRGALWDVIAGRHAEAKWGLRGNSDRFYFEPYTYASTLVDEALEWIDKIADATDAMRLFPPRKKDQPLIDDMLAQYGAEGPKGRLLALLG